MERNNTKIISLIRNSALTDTQLQIEKDQVWQRIQPRLHKRSNLLNFTQLFMLQRKYVLSVSVVAIALVSVVGASGYAYWKLNSNQVSPLETQDIAENTGTMSASGLESNPADSGSKMALPTEKVNSLQAAQAKVNFTVRSPKLNLKGEKLTDIVVGAKKGEVDNTNTLYLNYMLGDEMLYSVSANTRGYGIGERGEKVKVNGFDGLFYKEDIQQEESVTSMPGYTPLSFGYLSWREGNVDYMINQFGQIDKNEMVKLANSMYQ